MKRENGITNDESTTPNNLIFITITKIHRNYMSKSLKKTTTFKCNEIWEIGRKWLPSVQQNCAIAIIVMGWWDHKQLRWNWTMPNEMKLQNEFINPEEPHDFHKNEDFKRRGIVLPFPNQIFSSHLYYHWKYQRIGVLTTTIDIFFAHMAKYMQFVDDNDYIFVDPSDVPICMQLSYQW